VGKANYIGSQTSRTKKIKPTCSVVQTIWSQTRATAHDIYIQFKTYPSLGLQTNPFGSIQKYWTDHLFTVIWQSDQADELLPLLAEIQVLFGLDRNQDNTTAGQTKIVNNRTKYKTYFGSTGMLLWSNQEVNIHQNEQE